MYIYYMYQTRWKYKLLLLLLLLLPTFSQAHKAYFGRVCVGRGGGEGVELRKHFTDCTLVEMLTTANDPDIIIN